MLNSAMRRIQTLANLTATTMALSACAVIPDAPNVEGIPSPQGSTVALGQPVRLGDLVVTPRQIVEDSRCAKDVQCIWAGRLIVQTRIDGAGWRDTANIMLGETYGTHGHVIALTSATPGKASGKDIPPEAYRFRYELR